MYVGIGIFPRVFSSLTLKQIPLLRVHKSSKRCTTSAGKFLFPFRIDLEFTQKQFSLWDYAHWVNKKEQW